MNFLELKKDRFIVYIVGGKMNEDISQNVSAIANWFVKNDITVMYSDIDKNSAVKHLVDEIIKKGGKRPLAILPFGVRHNNDVMVVNPSTNSKVFDDDDMTMGFFQRGKDIDELDLYFRESMQMVLNNLSDGLMVLNCGTEIIPGETGVDMSTAFLNSMLYSSPKKPAKIIVIDDKNCFKNFMETSEVKRITNLALNNTAYLKYYEKSKDFLDSVNHVSDKSNRNTNNFYRGLN